MSKGKARRQELANKFPEMDQRFQELKSEINGPHERLGDTAKEQKSAKYPT
ncbi:hypothetical protein Desdi_0380 [Desulfitobacterium dichloroeliminans LMG P-21439]|uniref:Uncharacterized protein n=1 Tax=Desulfitobacterium dichloroeliminans (strain LMG P-21439 / DCA1) TaxID=871963 RepID=L0F5J2_DESDL|nr:hypothetical protein [Desulfitobacterium dichloroeliminans]AGA67926.1 hypothetical protein Desdi_0380 [Desulfitobacterium dichloroeliminans LMG P-21439]